MTDEEKLEKAALAASKQKSLELLYDYTKFHIGAYLILASAYVSGANLKVVQEGTRPLNPWFVWPTVLMIMIAGMAAGVIVSSLTQWTRGGSVADFLASEIGPWNGELFSLRGILWTYIEHTAFWVGLCCALLSFAFPVNSWKPADGLASMAALSALVAVLFLAIACYLGKLKPSVVQVQLSFSEDRFRHLLSRWKPNELERFQKHFAADYLFIFAYACLGYASGVNLLNSTVAGVIPSFALVTAACFDVVENVLHQRFLKGSVNSHWFIVAGVAATLKFVLWGVFLVGAAARLIVLT